MSSNHEPIKIPDQGITLAVVIPTFNESLNVGVLIERLHTCLQGVSWEAVFVDDDSPDGTVERLRELAATDHHVRCIRRVGRRGLSSACIEGMLSTSAPFIAVMDADLQHDETLLPAMLSALRDESYDLVIGTRYMEGGSVGDWDDSRRNTSLLATTLSQRLLGLTIKDPMSGFFMLRRHVIEDAVYNLSSMGFKILVDLVVSSPKTLKVKEIPFRFGLRLAGESKLDNRVAWDYLMLLADKTVGRYIPVQLLSFASVGALGVLVHLSILWSAMTLLAAPFVVAQTAAVLISMVFNFFLNNVLTYRDKQLHGWAWWGGLLKFMLACGIGAASNVGVASYIYSDWGYWLFSGLAGILVGLMWNYVTTSLFVWPQKRKG
ncbi:MAG: glycosyltransferase [Burkholderiales bacterium]|nr:glycosyltransferase [Burkholderiales bacterium]